MAANNNKNSLLASQARELFTEHACRVLPLLSRALGERLLVLVDQPGSAPEMQERRDGWLAFQAGGTAWVNGTAKAWRKAQAQPVVSAAARSLIDSGKFELMGDEVMEDKILSSRLALRLLDFASWELNDLRLRIQSLEGIAELRKGDILRPEVLAEKLVEQWTSANLSRELWVLVQDTIQGRMAEHLLEAYHAANEFLVRQGVMAEIDLRPLVKRTPSAVVAAQPGSAARAADGGVADTGTGTGTGSATGPGGHGGSARGPGSDLGTFGGGAPARGLPPVVLAVLLMGDRP
ncbi:hypothetical protein D9M73_50410 [compost metagenome]